MADVKLWGSIAVTLLVFGFTLTSLVMTAMPIGTQNSSLLGVTLTASILVSIVGWFLGYILFKGNPDAQLAFLMFFVFILFVSSATSAVVSAFQLYGLRDAVATNKQA
jgi:hypothetical protein